jgi:hypothetical protein
MRAAASEADRYAARLLLLTVIVGDAGWPGESAVPLFELAPRFIVGSGQ